MCESISDQEMADLLKRISAKGQWDTQVMQLTQNRQINTKDGTASVMNGQLKLADPQQGGSPAKIRCMPPVRLIVNGRFVEEAEVTSLDKIEWEYEQKPLYEIRISEDNMQASIVVHENRQFSYRLLDKEESAHLFLEAVEDMSNASKLLDIRDVLEQIQALKIKAEIDYSALFHELHNPLREPVVFAQGVPASPGIDARLELSFETHDRNPFYIPSVKCGAVIGKKIPMKDGSAGCDLFGTILFPGKPRDVVVVGGHGIDILPDGTIAATQQGRPRVTGTAVKMIDISPQYVVSGDVNLETGNIALTGDILIMGNVNQSMSVESLGNVYVFGNVCGAQISAKGSVHIKGSIINSKVNSGYAELYGRYFEVSSGLVKQLDKLMAAMKLIRENLGEKKKVHSGQIMRILLERKFHDIPKIARDLLMAAANIGARFILGLNELKKRLTLLLQSDRMRQIDVFEQLANIQILIGEINDQFQEQQENHVQVSFAQCHLTEIHSIGDIVIRGGGAIQSRLFANGDIDFTDPESVCKASYLEAGKRISAQNAGGEINQDTVLKAEDHISVKKMQAGIIYVGAHFQKIYVPVEDFYMNADRAVTMKYLTPIYS